MTHHVALSIVGLERSPENGYFRAKLAQEKLIKESEISYSLIRATQFFEFHQRHRGETHFRDWLETTVSPAAAAKAV